MSSSVYIKNNPLYCRDAEAISNIQDVVAGIGAISNQIATHYSTSALWYDDALLADSKITPFQPQSIGHIINIWGHIEDECVLIIYYSQDGIDWVNTGKSITTGGGDVFLEIPFCAAPYVTLSSNVNVSSVVLYYGVSR